jgi:hypothetical protein
MITITLTNEQISAVVKPVDDRYRALFNSEIDSNDKRFKQQERKFTRRIDAANAKTAEWKQRYSETRKQLLEARTEIVELRRTLRERY